MTFLDTLRSARDLSGSVVHEFLAQHDPGREQLHLFFEGHEDSIFFRHFVEQRLSSTVRVCIYRCDGKGKVFEVFAKVVERHPGIRSALFFVDKDIDDILGVAWPTDPRIFVTDVYSVENYLSDRIVLQRFYRNAVKLTGVNFVEDPIFEHYEAERQRFRRALIPVMAWAVVHRQANVRPNLNNVHLAEMCEVDGDCAIRTKRGQRVSHLNKVTGVTARSRFRQVVSVTRALRRIAPERIIRGKFEVWFVVEFWKHLTTQLEKVAREAKGKVVIRPALERSSLVAVLTPYADVPPSLERFLNAHLTAEAPPPPGAPPQTAINLVLGIARRLFGA